jgi:tetratricopeptide (TPR) repeat protein
MLAFLALVALMVALLVLVFLQLQTRWGKLQHRWPARRIRRPTLQVAEFHDGALAKRLGPPIAGLIRGKVSWRKDRYGVGLVSGQAGIASSLNAMGDISRETKTAVALVNALLALLPRRRFVLTGDLLPTGTEGPGISLELHRQDGVDAVISFRATPLQLPAEEEAHVYERLAVASAAWVDHHMASAVDAENLLSRDPRSWAFFRCGVECQQQGDSDRARALYEQALVMDGENVGALANLGIMERRANHYGDAKRLLNRALKALSEEESYPRLPHQYNPDWYRIKYQLVALYSNRAAETQDGLRKQKLLKDTAEQARELATKTSQTLEELSNPQGHEHAPVGFLEETVKPFLEGTIEPSALVVLADTAALSDGASRPANRPTRAEVLNALEAEPIDPATLIAFVEMGPNRPPGVLFDLACFYSNAGDFRRATKRLVRALRDTPRTQREGLVDGVQSDPTLAALRERLPGIVPKLRTIISKDIAHDETDLAAEFDAECGAFDHFESRGWEVDWDHPDESGFNLRGKRDGEWLLVKIVRVDPADNAQVLIDTVVGARTRFCDEHPDKEIVHVALVVWPGELDLAGLNTQDIEVYPKVRA